jgi:hypothetical protein
VHGRAATEEAGSSGVDCDGVESVRRGLESFEMKSKMTWNGLLFIYQRWFKTAADNSIISSNSKLKPLLIS